jgi:hypothetical protein
MHLSICSNILVNLESLSGILWPIYRKTLAEPVATLVRTLEDGAQTLLADSSLPPYFLGDAVLTIQYL